MQLIIDIPTPKFQIGDVISRPIGPDGEPPTWVAFAVCSYDVEGTYFWCPHLKNPNAKPQASPYRRYAHNTYVLSCQEDVYRPDGKLWLYKRQVLAPDIIETDEFSHKIEWDKEILPLATTEYLDSIRDWIDSKS